MIKYGTNNIGKIYFGSNPIGKAYLGSNLVFNGGGAPTPRPYDSRVEYLESTGVQYINTEYIPNPNTVLVIDASLTVASNNISLCGIYRESSPVQRFHISTYQSKWHFGVSNTSAANKYVNFSGTMDNNRHTFVIKGDGDCAVDSVVNHITVNNGGTYIPPIVLFARYFQSSNKIDQYSKMRLYSASISENGVVLHDFVPVRVGQVGYLYDKVSEKLLENKGNGSFTFGADI